MTEKTWISERDWYAATHVGAHKAQSAAKTDGDYTSYSDTSNTRMATPESSLGYKKQKRGIFEVERNYASKRQKFTDTPEDLMCDRPTCELYMEPYADSQEEMGAGEDDGLTPSTVSVASAPLHDVNISERENITIIEEHDMGKEDPTIFVSNSASTVIEDDSQPALVVGVEDTEFTSPENEPGTQLGHGDEAGVDTEFTSPENEPGTQLGHGDEASVDTEFTSPENEPGIQLGHGDEADVDTDYHAIHCGSPNCDQCVQRRRGFDVWDAKDTQDPSDIYTKYFPMFIQTYDGVRNALAILLNQRLMEVIQEAVAAGKRYRTMKKEIELEVIEVLNENEETYENYHSSKRAYNALKQKMMRHRRQLDPMEKQKLRELKGVYKASQHRQQILENKRHGFISRLKNEKKAWTSRMRSLEYRLQCLLGEAGVIPEEDVDHWNEKDYELDHFLKSIYSAKMAQLEEDEVASNSGEDERETPEDQALVGRHQYHKQQITKCQQELGRADRAHERHREIYNVMLEEFRWKHPNLSKFEAEQKFGPLYVQEWKCCIQALRNAEEALRTAKAEAADELSKGKFEMNKEAERERCLEDIIQGMNERLIQGCDRGRIETWLSEVATDLEPAVLSIDDSAKLWKEPEYQSTTKQDRTKAHNGAGTNQNTLDDRTSADNADDDWVLVPREETAVTPIFGSEGLARPPHMKMAFLDSLSVFDGDEDYRGDIDKYARNLRNGCY